MKRKTTICIGLIFGMMILLPGLAYAQQGFLQGGQVHGNFQLDAQYYEPDSAIGAFEVPEKFNMNAYADLIYTNDNFSAGIRYEAYLNPLEGYDPRWEGHGIAYRYARYRKGDFDITVGNYYEQFGSGLIFRSYEEPNLGYDNAMDGVRVKYNPAKGINFTGLMGKQRLFWDQGPGIVRGADAEFYLNELVSGWQDKKLKVILGGSFISKYQPDEVITFTRDDSLYQLNLPENVGAFAGRLNLMYGPWSLTGEYAYKANDPSSVNNLIYRQGQGLVLTGSYSVKGLGITLSAKRIDNMSFKSSRTELGNVLDINYLPAMTRQHSYSLASIYPYATQPNGEFGLQGQVIYSIPEETAIGGKYGTDLSINYSLANSIETERISSEFPVHAPGTDGYESDFFAFGDERYFRDINVEVRKKFSKSFKGVFSWVNLDYNIDVIEGHPGEPMVHANVFIADMTYKFTYKKSLRMELQHLSTEEDDGDWAMAMLEYNVAPHWFFVISDDYNYGNPVENDQHHYYNLAFGYNQGANRISLSWGKQREGIICVGGVCRNVPAASGLKLSISSSF
ncbi:MAG: DUF6029 family protein [Bacteroidales bacterium]|nr:DUF6029 family protein [Bacteroidales bacterium]